MYSAVSLVVCYYYKIVLQNMEPTQTGQGCSLLGLRMPKFENINNFFSWFICLI